VSKEHNLFKKNAIPLFYIQLFGGNCFRFLCTTSHNLRNQFASFNSLYKKRAVGILLHFQIDKVTSKQRWVFLRKCGTVSQEKKQVTVEHKGTKI